MRIVYGQKRPLNVLADVQMYPTILRLISLFCKYTRSEAGSKEFAYGTREKHMFTVCMYMESIYTCIYMHALLWS